MAEDSKFVWQQGKFVNRVSGEAIPDDEPVFIFRARDHHALSVLTYYQRMLAEPHHQQAVQDRIDEFTDFRLTHPDRMKEPGITRHIRLNRDRHD